MSNRSRLGILSLLLALAALLPACGGEPTVTPVVQGNNGPAGGSSTQAPSSGNSSGDNSGLVRLGFAFSTSGDNAPYGGAQRRAAEMAWHEIEANGGINGHHIAAIFQDTASNTEQATKIVRGYISGDDVLAIVGPTLDSEATVIDPLAQQNQVPVLSVSNTTEGITGIGDYIFRDSLTDSQVIAQTVKQAKASLGISKVSILYADDNASGKSGYDAFKAELQKDGIQVLSEQTFSNTGADFRPQLTKIKAENPDAIVVSGLYKPAQTILQQARTDVGIDPKVHIIGSSWLDSVPLVKSAGPAAEGLVVGSGWDMSAGGDLNQKFIANYKKIYGIDPDGFAAQAYAGFYILADAVSRANITDFSRKSLKDNRIKVHDALKATKNLQTILGSFTFTDKREASYPPVVLMVTNGLFAPLK